MNQPRSGFSLLEVMVAMATVAVLIAGLVAATVNAGSLNTTTDARSKVMQRTRQLVEEIQLASDIYATYGNGWFEVAPLEPIPGRSMVLHTSIPDAHASATVAIPIEIEARWQEGRDQDNAYRITFIHTPR